MAIADTPWPRLPQRAERTLVALLDSFIITVFDLRHADRVLDLEQVPAKHQELARLHSEAAAVWTAWDTPQGIWLALGRIDSAQSERIRAPVLWIDWIDPAGKHHRGWWHSYRPNEWIAGRGSP